MLSEAMDDPELHLPDDPTYRAGVLMGRQQAVTDVMERLLSPDGGTAQDRVMALLEWCAQTHQEGRIELELVIQDLKDQDSEE